MSFNIHRNISKVYRDWIVVYAPVDAWCLHRRKFIVSMWCDALTELLCFCDSETYYEIGAGKDMRSITTNIWVAWQWVAPHEMLESVLAGPHDAWRENGMLFASVQHNIVLEDNIFLLVRSTWNWWRWNNIDWVGRMVCHIRNDIHFTCTELWLIGSNYKNSRIIFIIVVCIADSDKLELLRRQWFTNNRRPASSILLLAL